MESRRVTLIRKGILRGWLKANPVTKYSALREELIIRELEEDEIRDLYYLRSLMDATIASGINKPEVIKIAFSSYDAYRELALPWLFKDDKMEKGSSKQEMAKKLKSLHERNKVAFEALKAKRAMRQDTSKESKTPDKEE